MTAHNTDWHGLTFDPARGNPDTVGTLSKQLTDTSDWLKETYDVLQRVKSQKETWTGKASKAFVDHLGEAPKMIDDAHTSLAKAGKALSSWQGTLTGHQRTAIDLEKRARQALAEAQRADKAAESADAANTPITYDAGDPAAAGAARRQAEQNQAAADRAAGAAQDAWDRLDDIRRKGRDLMDRWEDDAQVAIDALEDAADIAPGFWDAVGDVFSDIGNWFKDHLGDIGDIAGAIAAVAGALSFIPVLAPITGPIALAAGGVALAAHSADMAVKGNWDKPSAWVGLGADALGMIPGVGVATRGLSGATRSLTHVKGLTPALAGGARGALRETKAVFQEAQNVAKPAAMYQWLGDRVAGAAPEVASTIAKTTEGAVDVGLQVPTIADKMPGADVPDQAKDAAGYAGGAIATGKNIRDAKDAVAHGGADLGDALRSFSRALG